MSVNEVACKQLFEDILAGLQGTKSIRNLHINKINVALELWFQISYRFCFPLGPNESGHPFVSTHWWLLQEALNVNRTQSVCTFSWTCRGCKGSWFEVCDLRWILLWATWLTFLVISSDFEQTTNSDQRMILFLLHSPPSLPPPWELLPILKELPLQSNVPLMKNTYPQAFFQPVLLMWPLLNCVPLLLISVNKCN